MTEPFPGGITAPSDWIDGILPMIPGGSQDWIKNEILIKLRTFFTISGAWRDWIGPIVMVPETVYYSPELTDVKAEMVAVLGMKRERDGTRLSPLVAKDQYNIFEPGDPSYFHQTPEGLLQIWPPVHETKPNDGIFAYVTMRPIDLCVPEFIKLKYFDPIRTGVLSAAYLMPGINYKPELGARLEKRFRSQMSRATKDTLANETALPQIAKPPLTVFGSQNRRFGSARVIR